MKTWYGFAKGKTDGDQTMRNLLGGKGANLAEMCALGIPVPPGFTLPTSLCVEYTQSGASTLSADVRQAIAEGIGFIEENLPGTKLGDKNKPLLVSVRSGARVSMPGMMDTVLNVGLTKETVEALSETTGNRRFALDSYRRLIQMYGDVVKGVDRELLEEPLEMLKKEEGVTFDSELSVEALERLVEKLSAVYKQETGDDFPQDPKAQIEEAVAAVFQSWGGKRAISYRAINRIPDDWGTAANVQAMVFGNFSATSATGVAFTRDPSTGENCVMGEWLPNAQGEDVVAGIRTPGPLDEKDAADSDVGSLEDKMPEADRELREVMAVLEKHYKDMQDIEFTVQDDQLYLLQTRHGKRTAKAALQIALEMVDEGLIDTRTAVSRVSPEQIDQLMHPQIDPAAEKDFLAKGLPASPGAASGLVVLDADTAEAQAKEGQAVILVRKETSPEDIHGMHAAKGILTQTGGMTSHAAVVARGMGRTCVAGCAALSIDEAAGTVTIRGESGERTIKAGDQITLDGSAGEVYLGEVPTIESDLGGDFAKFLGWADEIREVKVRANADSPEDAQNAINLGAEGIGLCRTEHMFFGPDRIGAVREMILADDTQARERALAKLEPMQRSDFEGIFKAMAGKPVTIRLLDPPLHEFLPHDEADMQELAGILGTDLATLKRKNESLHEFNPMLGHRGCRLGLTYPEVYSMQARAIVDAACAVMDADIEVLPEIMIPLIMHPHELKRLRAQVQEIIDAKAATREAMPNILIGTMIELPRAALVADQVAEYADFYSFGTNDLTQTTLGLSRDDSGKFLPFYVEEGFWAADPFASLDQSGVGVLVELGTRLGRKAKPGLKVGVCGEHGGDPASIEFFVNNGLDYVSCSPFRVPIARIAAAHAALNKG
ncbi:MAG: pyruvate, phosphate dikinase [Myxococcota bacterium]|jgi:pyruvate,orthophosphate dikinase|nr:pyruvate, phosphate dikinase [Myxococcota bacterium]